MIRDGTKHVPESLNVSWNFPVYHMKEIFQSNLPHQEMKIYEEDLEKATYVALSP